MSAPTHDQNPEGSTARENRVAASHCKGDCVNATGIKYSADMLLERTDPLVLLAKANDADAYFGPVGYGTPSRTYYEIGFEIRT